MTHPRDAQPADVRRKLPRIPIVYEQNVGESVAGGLGRADSSPFRALFSISTTSAKDCFLEDHMSVKRITLSFW